MATKTSALKNKLLIDANPVESLRDVGAGVTKSVVNDLGKAGMTDFWDQLFGETVSHKKRTKGDLSEGQELDLTSLSSYKGQKEYSKQAEKPARLDIEPGIDYRREILHGEKRIAHEDAQEIKIKIQEIIIELKKLVGASQELQVTFKEAVVEQRIENPGVYHKNFFDWLLGAIRQARLKVEDSGAWLNALKSKKKGKQYWSMFKKHGTTFGLSGERTVATQTG